MPFRSNIIYNKSNKCCIATWCNNGFAIFLYHSYKAEKEKVSNNDEAMATAIAKTLVSVLGSSLTTIAGFLALCSMNLTLGKDIGLVMAKVF